MSVTINNINQVSGINETTNTKSEPKQQVENEKKTSIASDSVEISNKKSMREERPLTINLNAGFPNGLNLGVNYNISDKFSVGGNIGTLGIINDYSVDCRYYFAGWERFGLYTQTGGHLVQNNLYGLLGGNQFAGAVSQTVGLEFRARNGFTVNSDVGLAIGLAGAKVSPIPAFNVGVGYSF